MSRVLVALFAVAACGDDQLEVDFHGGSRLALQWYLADDGTRVPTSAIHDLVRDEACWPQDFSDGVVRCMGPTGFVVYLDAGCSQPGVLGDPGQLAAEWDNATCSARGVFEVGAATTETRWYYPRLDGECMGPYQTSVIYRRGAGVAPDVFASITKTAPAGGDRLRQSYYTSADGLRVPGETRDVELGVACFPGPGGCSPAAASSSVYLDDACSEPILPIYDTDVTCGQPIRYVAVQDETCASRTRFYGIGDTIAVTALYERAVTGECMATTPSTSASYHRYGAEVTPAAMSLAIAAPGEHRRLAPLYFAGSGIAVRTGSFYDRTLGVTCELSTASDGTTRCLPVGAGWYTFYSDSACTRAVRIARVPAADGSCPAEPPSSFAQGYTNQRYEVRVVTGLHVGSLYAPLIFDGDCAPAQLGGDTAYDVGDVVAPESFVGATSMYE